MQAPQLQLGMPNSPLRLRESEYRKSLLSVIGRGGADSNWISSGNQGWFCQCGATRRN